MRTKIMRQMVNYPVLSLSFSGALIAIVLFIGVWGQLLTVLQEGHTAETQRLLDAFEQPLAEALGKRDDLLKIDQLRRLKKLPGVATAEVESDLKHQPYGAKALTWEGKTVGWMTIHLTKTRWLRLRYSCVERMWTLVIVMGLIGGLVGGWVQKRKRTHLTRLQHLLERQHRYHRIYLGRLQNKMANHLILWTRQAMTLAPNGLVLLDSRQSVVAVNLKAQEAFQLPPDAVGKHWLDLKHAPEWASALQQSMDQPGKRIPGP